MFLNGISVEKKFLQYIHDNFDESYKQSNRIEYAIFKYVVFVILH